MNVPFVDLKVQYQTIAKDVNSAIKLVLETSQFVGGEQVTAFEAAFCKYLHIKNTIGCANGTDAIEIALLALGIGKGDEVIVPAVSWVSTASAVHTVGAKPVFVDIDTETYTINTALIEEKITDRTQAIIPVHLYGQMADMREIKKIATSHDLFIIEDAAQAVGASQDGKLPGYYGDIAAFSFYPGKNLGAMGDAGAIIANEEVLAKNARVIARLGQRKKHDHVALGRNSQLDSLQAAIIRAKLKYLDKWNASRNRLAKVYDDLLVDLPIQLPMIAQNNVSNYHIYAIQVPNRNSVLKQMNEAGIQCQVHYPKALVDLPPLKEYAIGDYPVARQLAESSLSLPMYPEMTMEQVNAVSKVLHDVI